MEDLVESILDYVRSDYTAKEETRTEGTRFQTENVNKERQKGTCSPSCKGQKATFLLITDWVRFGEKQNLKGK